MMAAQRAVLRALPNHMAPADPLSSIAERAGLPTSTTLTWLECLMEQNLAERITVPYGRYFGRTPAGDREAGRAR